VHENLGKFSVLVPKTSPKLDHPVSRLFLRVQGGSTTQKNRLELLFPLVSSKKIYRKNWPTGWSKQWFCTVFVHALYTSCPSGPWNLRGSVEFL